MDNQVDPEIVFDSKGICNHCHTFDQVAESRLSYKNNGKALLSGIIGKIKKDGKGKEYNCIIGASGGVDSSYLAWYVKQQGLKPLVVHLDNGWDSELAVKNIENIIRKLGFDLYTQVINWEEFKDLQLAYLRAGVIDIEVASDHAIFAILYHMAAKYKVKYILSGENFATEGLLPSSWVHNKFDVMNLKAIHKKFGNKKLRSYPLLGGFRKFWYTHLLGIKYISVLNFIDFNKATAKETIISKLEWRDYGGKHYESIFTRFYQAYILTKKFGVDKRRSHLSTLVCSGQISREQAMEEIKLPVYDPVLLKEDKQYVLKKLGLPEQEFDRMMEEAPVSHYDFPSVMKWRRKLRPAKRFLKGLMGK
jgi:N-acetyl sugar amidotransferase